MTAKNRTDLLLAMLPTGIPAPKRRTDEDGWEHLVWLGPGGGCFTVAVPSGYLRLICIWRTCEIGDAGTLRVSFDGCTFPETLAGALQHWMESRELVVR